MSNRKTRIFVGFVLALLIASVTLMAMPFQPIPLVQGGAAVEVHTSPSNVYGYPNLGPLPSGVTPNYEFEKQAYMSITPNPVGVGQQVLVNVWTTPGQPDYFYMYGYKVTIQKPDGTTEVIGPFNSFIGDDSAWFTYTVDQVGTWRWKFEDPGTYVPAGKYVIGPGRIPPSNANFTLGASMYYKPSSTDWQNLTVQADMIASWPSVPLPTDYWRRPASTENREWWSILGNYPWSGAYYYPGGRVLYSSNYKYTAYVQAPSTGHVVWRRLGAISGLMGGEQYQTSQSSSPGNPNIIYAGRCYQTVTKPVSVLTSGALRTQSTSVWECYDLRTGQVYWDLTDITAPTNILYESPTSNMIPGSEASSGYTVYLVGISGGRLLKYNPYTGVCTYNISLPSYITSGTIYNNEWVLTIQTINANAGNYRLINWSMTGSSTDFLTRIGTNITWPVTGVAAMTGAPSSSLGTIDYDAGISASVNFNVFFGSPLSGPSNFCLGSTITSVDLYTGAVLFTFVSNDSLRNNYTPTNIVNRGKIAFANFNRQWSCFDGRTGHKLWESEQTNYPWGNWWAYNTASYDFNESKSAIIGSSYDGIYAIDWDTGKIIWHYSSPMPPFESPYVGEPFFTGVLIADGKVYAYGGEHTPSQPITRGWHLHCINATTGEGIWKITGPMSTGAVADGYLTASNTYDGYMYVFGKGKSQTTVTAPDTAVPKGTGVLIHGTVMDMSPGDQGSIQNPTARLDSPSKPGTVPCVSAASMETQMEYLYMQHPIDGLYHNETIAGVPVAITAIDASGNVIDIGTTTSNGYYGTFSLAWTPPSEGVYTIMASFAGDDSYGSSTAATAVSVGPAPSEAPTATPTAPINMPPFEIYTVGTGIAVIIAIALAVLILRKRP